MFICDKFCQQIQIGRKQKKFTRYVKVVKRNIHYLKQRFRKFKMNSFTYLLIVFACAFYFFFMKCTNAIE